MKTSTFIIIVKIKGKVIYVKGFLEKKNHVAVGAFQLHCRFA
jgi:hypothetical protein